MIYYLNGQKTSEDKALAESLSPGVLKATGAFETLRVYGGKLLFLEEHVDRLQRGLSAQRLHTKISVREAQARIQELLKANRVKNARVRYMVWNNGGRLQTTVSCAALNGLNKNFYHARVSAYRRNRTRTSHLKTLRYGQMRKAYLDAAQKGFDEAILLNDKKHLVEGSRSNIFFVKDGCLMTPSVSCGCLNGITRTHIIQLAKEHHIKLRTGSFRLKSLQKADEAFLTNSVVEVMPLTKLDDQSIGSGRPGPLTGFFRDLYRRDAERRLKAISTLSFSI